MWPFSRKENSNLPVPVASNANEMTDPAQVVSSNDFEGVFNVSDVSYAQLLDVINGSGDDGLSVLYKPRFYNRNSAICLVALNRAVTLISSVTRMLLKNNHFRVVDRNGNKITDPALVPQVEAFHDLMATSLDGWENAGDGIKDAMADFLLDGNFLFAVVKNSGGQVERLVSLTPWSANTMNRTTDGFDYHAEVKSMRGYKGAYVTLPNTEVVHGRMAHLSRIHGSNGNRQLFARSPVVLMRPTLEAGLELDNYVRNFARRGHVQNLSFNFKDVGSAAQLTPVQKKELSAYIQSQLKKEQGYVVQQEGTSVDVTPKIDPNLAALREWQVQDVARFYGVPGPIIALNLTSWGQGIQELGRFFINYSVSLHVQDFCDALAFRCLPRGARIEPNYHKLLTADPAGVKNFLDALRGDGQRPGIGTLGEAREAAGLSKEWDGELLNQNPSGMQKAKEMNALDKDGNNNDDGDGDENDSGTMSAEQSRELLEWMTK